MSPIYVLCSQINLDFAKRIYLLLWRDIESKMVQWATVRVCPSWISQVFLDLSRIGSEVGPCETRETPNDKKRTNDPGEAPIR